MDTVSVNIFLFSLLGCIGAFACYIATRKR